MQENKKKLFMIGVIVVSLTLSGIVFLSVRDKSHGIESIGADERLLVKCSNPDCDTDYEMSKRDYFEFLKENMSPLSAATPPLACEQCGEESIYRAVRCEDCEVVFFYGEIQGDFKDRCPECDFSKIESLRNK